MHSCDLHGCMHTMWYLVRHRTGLQHGSASHQLDTIFEDEHTNVFAVSHSSIATELKEPHSAYTAHRRPFA